MRGGERQGGMAGGVGAGAGTKGRSPPEGEGAQGLPRPFLSPLGEEAALSSKGAAFPEQLLPAGQHRLPLRLPCLLPSPRRSEGQSGSGRRKMLCLPVAFQLLLVLVLCSQGTERCPSAFCECSDWDDYKITCRDIHFIPRLPEDTQTL